MTDLAAALGGLREVVAACAAGRAADVAAVLDRPEFASTERHEWPGRDALAHVTVDLAEPVALAELEELFGPSRALPRRPEGGTARTMIFDDTLPDEGESGATVLAEADDEGIVRRLTIRADSFA
jgi:hypothetical protein